MAIIIPKSWDEINVDKFLEIYNYKLEDFDSQNQYYQNLLSILSDVPIEQIADEMDYEDFVEEINDLFFITQTPFKFTKPYIDIDNELRLYLLPLDNLTIGEFIDLENFCKESYMVNFKKILSILYRQQIKKGDRLFNPEYEPYGNYIFLRERLFNSVCINEVYGSIISYFKYRDNIYQVFEGLFNMNGNQEQVEEDLSDLSRAERLEVQKEIEKEKKIALWGWDMLLYKLANNDPTKILEATNMPLIQALNVLSMKKELNLD